MRKKIIGLFLLLVFSIQLMPIMQIGLVLAEGQLTEEQCSINEDHSKLKETSLHLLPGELQLFSTDLLTCMVTHHENLNSRHADDIQTPPPNLQ